MDPHKRSATIEVINDREKVLAQGRFSTDRDGYQPMLTLGRQHKGRVWAVEGCNGIGRHLAQRLVADSEPVLDVPAELSARPGVRHRPRPQDRPRRTPTTSRSPRHAAKVYGKSSSTT